MSDSISGGVAFGIAVGIVSVLGVSAIGAGLWLAGKGASYILANPLLKGIAIGAYAALALVTVIAIAFWDGGEDE